MGRRRQTAATPVTPLAVPRHGPSPTVPDLVLARAPIVRLPVVVRPLIVLARRRRPSGGPVGTDRLGLAPGRRERDASAVLSAGTPDLTGDLLALGTTAPVALMMVIMRRHPDRPMTLAVGPVSCLQLVAIAWVMGARHEVTRRELVLLTGFGVVHAAATGPASRRVLRIRAAAATPIGALEVPLAPLWGWLILSEVPRTPTGGGAVVLARLAWYLGRETRVRS